VHTSSQRCFTVLGIDWHNCILATELWNAIWKRILNSHNCGYEYFWLRVWRRVVWKSPDIWEVHVASSQARNQREEDRKQRLVSCLAYSSTLKTESISSSETVVDFQQTTQRYIPEDRTLRLSVNLCRGFKSPCSVGPVLPRCGIQIWRVGADNRQGLILQLECWVRGLRTLHYTFDGLPKRKKLVWEWSIRSLYRTCSRLTVARKITNLIRHWVWTSG
jgi:hypothetical protein